eukprot:1153173-Pelagomonas_calceolata.AAC.4
MCFAPTGGYQQELAKIQQGALADGIEVEDAVQSFVSCHLSARSEEDLPWESQLAVLRHDRGSSTAEMKKLVDELCRIEQEQGICPWERWKRDQDDFVRALEVLKQYKMRK